MENDRSDKISDRNQQDIHDTFDGVQGVRRRKVEHIRYAVLKAAENERGDAGKHQKIFREGFFIVIAPEIIHRDIDEDTA